MIYLSVKQKWCHRVNENISDTTLSIAEKVYAKEIDSACLVFSFATTKVSLYEWQFLGLLLVLLWNLPLSYYFNNSLGKRNKKTAHHTSFMSE